MTTTIALLILLSGIIGFFLGIARAGRTAGEVSKVILDRERAVADERIASAVQAGKERAEWAEAREKQAAEALRQVMEFNGLRAVPKAPEKPVTPIKPSEPERVDYRVPQLRGEGVAISPGNPAHDETSLQSTAGGGGGSPSDAGALNDAFAEQVAGLAALEAKQ